MAYEPFGSLQLGSRIIPTPSVFLILNCGFSYEAGDAAKTIAGMIKATATSGTYQVPVGKKLVIVGGICAYARDGSTNPRCLGLGYDTASVAVANVNVSSLTAPLYFGGTSLAKSLLPVEANGLFTANVEVPASKYPFIRNSENCEMNSVQLFCYEADA